MLTIDGTGQGIPIDEWDGFEAPLPTRGSSHCGGSHYARATYPGTTDQIVWVCQRCGMENVIADRQGWR